MTKALLLKASVVALAFVFVVAASPARLADTKLVMTIAGKGKVEITLYTDKAPKTCEHVIALAEAKFYDGQKFFNVMKSPKPFLVKLGDPTSRTKSSDDPELGKTGSGKAIEHEDSSQTNVRGAVGLSTLPKDPNSGDSIFYISLAENRFLDGKYTVFGHVTSGMDVVDKVERGDEVSSVTVVRG